MQNEIKVLCAYKELVDINSLKPNPLNANNHPTEQIELFKKIILYNGVRRPITVSNRSGYITKGHGEWETLKALGAQKVPVDFQDYDDELQEIADMNADNALSRMSYFDTTKMQELVIKLDEANVDLELMGVPQNKAEILATQPPAWFSENQDPFFGSVPKLDNPQHTPDKKEIQGEESLEITKELNYLVFTFSDKEKFARACEKYNIQSVKLNPARNYHDSFQINGLGRIASGDQLL